MTVAETTKIKAFWLWFVNNHRKVLAPQVIGRIQKINRGLVADFELPETGGQQKLVVSARGDIKLFTTVVRVVTAAPLKQLPGWEIIAFRQARAGHFSLSFEGFRLATDMVMMQPTVDTVKRKVHLVLAIQNWDSDSTEKVAAVKLLLENLLGEYKARLTIGEVMVQSWEGELAGDNWLPLVRLPQIIESTLGPE